MIQKLTFELEYGYVDSYSYEDENGDEIWEDIQGVIHMHFDCPCCHTKNAETDIYSEFYDVVGNKFICRSCHSKFELVDDTDCAPDERFVSIIEDMSNEED